MSRDPVKLSARDTRVCVSKLLEACQNAGYHGEIKLKLRDGLLFNVEFSQTALPRSILDSEFLCVLLKSRANEKDDSSQASES